MATITTLNDGITGASFRGQVNTNFANLNADKAETSALTSGLAGKQDTLVSGTNIKTVNGNSLLGSGDISISGGSGDVATDTIWDAKGDLAVGTGANTASRLAVGTNGQVLTADSAEATGVKWSNPAGGGDALTSGTLAQFASTTSAQLAGVISDETGSGGVLVFSNSPALTTPSIAAINVSGGTLTLPTGASDTLVGKATTDTLTNKSISLGTNIVTTTKAQLDTAVTDGNIVYVSDSPTLGTITTTGSIELGHASDTTISRVSSGVVAVEGITLSQTLLPTVNTDGATITFNLASNNKHQVTIAGNRTLALSNSTNVPVFKINIKQDATGSRTVTWFSGISWVGGTVPTLTTTANKTDSFGFEQTSAGVYIGYILGQNI